ncbi:MAG: trigger factor [Deltaproteobacteria bacterium]|nr:MAG: trigger factor [Deltaproteobacteria bacterium]
MKFELEEISPTEKKINVEIPHEEVEKILSKKYKELRKRVKIKGFRPGKAPRFMLERFYGPQVNQETVQELLEINIPKILEESEIEPLVELEYDFEEIDFKGQKPLKFSAIAEVKPEITIEDYRGIPLKKEVIEVTDREVEEKLQELRENNAYLETVEEPPPVKEGDFVVIDFDTMIDGEKKDDLSAVDFTLEVGKAQIHADFDSQLLGMKVGETRSVKIQYSPETPNKELAGKEVEFKVTLEEVKQKVLPELDDEFARDLGDFSSLEEIKEKIREELLKMKESRSENMLREQLFNALLERTSFELPRRLVEREMALMVEQFKKQLEARGLTLPDIHSSEDALKEQYRPEAERRTKLALILGKIAELEGISGDGTGSGAATEKVIEKLIEWAEVTEVPEGTLEEELKKEAEEKEINAAETKAEAADASEDESSVSDETKENGEPKNTDETGE